MATENAADESNLTAIKNLFEKVRGSFGRFIKPQSADIDALTEVLKDATNTNRMGSDEEFQKFVNDEMAIGIMSKLAGTASTDDVFLAAVADLMTAFVDLYANELKQKRFSEMLTCAMTWCFKADTALHSNHFQFSEQDLKSLATHHQIWRKELQVGDKVDVNIGGDDKSKTTGWVQGKIVDISGDKLSIEFPDLPPQYDCDTDRWSINLMKFESKTKEDYEWRRSWANLESKDIEVDMHDGYKWEEGTIFDITEEDHQGRSILIGNCAFRIYRTVGKKIREDERGIYDGWSVKYDEYIPIFSPRVQKHMSQVNGVTMDEDYDEDMDEVVTPSEGHDRVYCVPRIGNCLSKRFLYMLNCFGNSGGFAAILDTFANAKPDDKLTLTMMLYMVRMISMPIKLFHKDWINEFGVPIAEAIMNQLLNATDKVLRDITHENINQLQISINGINNRVMEKEKAKQAQNNMKLEMCKKFLASELLDRRILGIKELNTTIRNTSHSYGNNVFTLEQLINWCSSHGIFDILWDHRKTHQQLVQRSNELFKILPKEDLLSLELLQQFWSLTKSDYKSEVFKIINETAFYLKQEHIEFLFDQITETPAAKLGMEEFEAIASLGSASKSLDFSAKSSDFFWSIITDSNEHKQELIENVVNKFSDMIKYSSMEKKAPYFDKLVEQLADGNSSAVPVIRLFKKIIKDQKARAAYSSTSTYTGTGTYGSGATTVVNHTTNKTADGKTLYSRSYTNTGGESIYPNNGQGGGSAGDEDLADGTATKATLSGVLNAIDSEKGFVNALLDNLKNYCELVAARVISDPSLLQQQDRSKIFIASAKYSHHDELNERLSFLQEFAVNSDFKISKVQLKVIYDLLTTSPIKSDFTEFLTWCSTACKAVLALDLTLVGEFFSELISTSKLDLAALPVVGFQFLKMHFTSLNVVEGKLTRIVPPAKKFTASSWANYQPGQYGSSSYGNDKKEEDEDKTKPDDATVTIEVLPQELSNLDIMWTIALESQVPEVVTQSIAFLVNCYLSVSLTLEDKRTDIMQSLNSRCFELLSASEDKPDRTKRLVRILETVIQISEKKGTGGVQPHNAILKGEMLDRIIVRYMVKSKVGYYNTTLKTERSIVVKLYTSATVWELKLEVSKIFGLSPKYMKLKLPNDSVMRENQHGQTLQELNMRNGDILTATKINIVENVVEAPLVDKMNRCLTPRAIEVFTEWFHMYKNQESGLMDSYSVAKFIAGATKASCLHDDDRVEKIIKKYDTDNDEAIDLTGFLNFYYDAASGTNDSNVRKNIKSHNLRADLKKMSDIYEDVTFSETEMPRYTLSANQDQFQALFKLLDCNNAASKEVWDLVRMLATNQKTYEEVISLSNAQADLGISWAKVFEDQSLYRQIYKQEIIVAVMEGTNADEEGKRVMFVEDMAKASTYSAVSYTNDDGDFEEDKEAMQDSTQETQQAEVQKANWTKQFLEQAGWDYILSSLLEMDVSANATATFSDQANLKDLAFRLTLIRLFLQAGFNTQEGEIGQAARMVRRSSSIIDEGDVQKKSSGTAQFEELMKSADGQDIMLNTDFSQLFDKSMQLISTVLSKATLIYEDKIIIENAFSIVIGILLFKKDLYPKFESFTSKAVGVATTEQLVLTGLLSSEEKVRIDVQSSLSVLARSLCGGNHSALNFLMGILARNFGSISNKPSRQFFDLLNKLIDLKAQQDALQGVAAGASDPVYNPEELLNQTIDKIKQQQQAQAQAKADDAGEDDTATMELAAEQERLLVGLISLTGKIIAKADKAVSDRIISEKDLIGQIFKEFLFASYFQAREENPDGDAIMIQQQSGSRKQSKKTVSKNNKSRQAAYELLHQLIQNSSTLMKKFLAEHLQPLITTIKKPKTWNYQPATASDPSAQQKYVGMVNLGCICYMNSMMQQFFMTAAFRYNLLCVDDGKDLEMAEYKGDKIDDNMMHQLQKLIAHLELSERQAYNPKHFCFAFKEFDGSPTNTAEQKDAQEFLNLLFDRLENSLKPTSRKHLVNGIFGGKMCSQMVCSECGKVKNRMEDYLNLSLPVKGLKSIEESLQKQVEGEIISDYQCDGCNRKVDLNKRTMIASTPNILIVHLQRICFNFDTFQNDKVNSFCQFPNMLDLKPYSFHEVMGKENRLKSQQSEDVQQTQVPDAELTEEQLEQRREAEQDAREPEQDDCYEYKLVGVNVHSGTANAGHYWSYINTNRGADEKPGDTDWIKTEQDPWMEFNDSRVSDWDFAELKQRTFGTEKNANQGGYMSSLGDSYGTSAYMLFYERRQKKDLKILIKDEEVKDAKAKGVNVQYDEAGKEYYEMREYRSAADGELANDIYKKVAEDNSKYTFESDIYSTEFFDFIMRILKSVSDGDIDDAAKLDGMQIGTKVGFEILARMFVNPGIDRLSQVMLDILASSPELSKSFLSKMCEFPESEVLWEVLFECGDKSTQKDLARIIKFALCQLKEVEKDLAISNETESVTSTFIDDDGVEQTSTVSRPKAVCLRFINHMNEQLSERAPKNWRKFDAFLEIYLSFMVNSSEDIHKDRSEFDSSSEAFKTGIELYYLNDMIKHLGDFVLQESSPYHEVGRILTPMIATYGTPNFGSLLKVIILMVSDKPMQAKYPLDDNQQAVVSHHEILQKMIEPGEGGADFSDVLIEMARENAKVSKKMAKTYLKAIGKTSNESLQKTLAQIRTFLQIDDNLKRSRLEWIFGIPQVNSKPDFRTRMQKYGTEMLTLVSDDYCFFKSACVKTVSDGFLGALFKDKGRMDTQCVVGLSALVQIMADDDDVARFVFNQPAPSIQYARYTDWFFPYAEQMQDQISNSASSSTMYDYQKQKREAVESIFMVKEALEAKFETWINEQKDMLSNCMDGATFKGYLDHSLASHDDTVLLSYPPAYIVGPICALEQPKTLLVEDTDLATITLEEVTCEYMYSNPMGLFNLSLPDKLWRDPKTYRQQGFTAWKILNMTDEERANGAADQIKTKDWDVSKLEGAVILRVVAKSKATRMSRVGIKLSIADDADKNVNFPLCEIKENLFSNDSKQLFVFTKIDPSKEGWGNDLKVEVIVKPGKTSQVYSGSNSYGGTSGGYGGGSGYSLTGTGATGYANSGGYSYYDQD